MSLPARPLRAVRAVRAGALAALVCSSALGGVSCASDQGSPFSAVVIAWDPKPDKQMYRLAQVRVATLASLRRLEGTSGTLRGGGAAQVDSTKLASASATVGSLSESFFTAQPTPVSLNYSVLNELVYPEDFLSLELLTAYYNVERARAAFALWGLTDATGRTALSPARMYAHATLEDERGLTPLRPGELYYPPLGAFFFAAASGNAQQLPVHFNLGAMAHAVALQAIQEKAWDGRPQDPATYAPATDPDRVGARHLWQAVSMGLADFLGAAAGEDPRWFEKSIAQEAASRNLDQLRCGDASMLAALELEDRPGIPPYAPYPLGTVLAAALWEATTNDPGVYSLKAAATDTVASITALGAIASQNGGKLSLTTALDTLVLGTSSGDAKAWLCSLFKNRFKDLSVTSLPACAAVPDSPPMELCQ